MNKKQIALFFVFILLVAAGAWWAIGTNYGVEPVQAFGALDSATARQFAANPTRKDLGELRKKVARSVPNKPYIVINTHANKLSLRTADSVMYEWTCSTGSGGELTDSATGRRWIFDTPRGVFKIGSKIKEPWWRKPDWAFIEEGEEIPKNAADRLDPKVMGDFALGFGDGYFIHGTIYERLLGVGVTHGCVRLGSQDLKTLYDRTPIGTQVYIF